jgi:hypothetical protein
MGTIRNAIGKTVRGAAMSYQRFPSAMIGATALTILTSIRIADNSLLEAGQFDKWQIIFALTAIISLTWSGWLYSRDKSERSEVLSLASLIVILPLALLIQPVDGRIPDLTMTRVMATGAIAIIVLLLSISRNSEKTDFNKRFFMLHKAFFIAMLYMLVVMGGLNFTAAAVEILLYSEMSSDVYQHLSTWSGFLGFAFFLGNLPNLRRTADFEQVHASQKQPKFIEVLFVFVMIPIVLMLSVVLLLWALRMLLTQQWPQFEQLASIFSGYVLLGVWLTIMVANAQHGLARFYRRVFPLVAILFLLVEAVAIVRQVNQLGIRVDEYTAAFIWLFGLSSAVFFLLRPVRFNHLTAWIAAGLIFVSVLPFAGYSDVVLASQVGRLEDVLIKNDMLTGEKIEPASSGSLPPEADQVLITEAVSYLSGLDRYEKLPGWFPEEVRIYSDFEKIFGFAQRWSTVETAYPVQKSAWVRAKPSVIDISEYDLTFTQDFEHFGIDSSFSTNLADYELKLQLNQKDNGIPPVLTLNRNGQVFVEFDLAPALEPLSDQVRDSENRYEVLVEPEYMQFEIEKENVKLLIVVESVDMNWENSDSYRYFVNIDKVYFAD